MHEDDTGTVGTTVGVGNGQNVGWASLESSEALTAMDDEEFARFTARFLASHRKIFMNQQRFWGWAPHASQRTRRARGRRSPPRATRNRASRR